MIIDRLNGKFQREFVQTENKMNTDDITNTTNPPFSDFLNQIKTPITKKKYYKLKDFLFLLSLDLIFD